MKWGKQIGAGVRTILVADLERHSASSEACDALSAEPDGGDGGIRTLGKEIIPTAV